MSTTLTLPDDVAHELSLRASREGLSIGDLAADLLRSALEREHQPTQSAPSAHGQVVVTKEGLPMVLCDPAAPAARMTIEELLALERAANDLEDSWRAGQPS